MSDIALDPTSHKVVLSKGRFARVAGVHARAQRLKIALLHFTGEWFRDQSAGTDYRGAIAGKNTDLARRAELRRRCLSVPGIRDVVSMTFTVDPVTRRAKADIVVVDEEGNDIPASVPTGG